MTALDMFHRFVESREFLILAVGIVVNLIFGILAALRRGDFTLYQVGDFLQDKILYLLVPYAVLWVAGDLLPDIYGEILKWLWVAAAGHLVASVINNLRDIGWNAPDGIVRVIEKVPMRTH